MLSQFCKSLYVSLVCAVFLGGSAFAQEKPGFHIEPVWEKIDGEWNFSKDKKVSHQILLHVTTTKHDKLNKNLLIKELVKLPFVIYLPQNQKGATPLVE